MSNKSYSGSSRKWAKQVSNRYIRRNKLSISSISVKSIFEDKYLYIDRSTENRSRIYKLSLCESDCSYLGESHNTKPLYKQINRETIRKWGDAA